MRRTKYGRTCRNCLLNSKRRHMQRILLDVSKQRDTLRLSYALADRVGEVGARASELENNEMEL